VNKKIDMTEDTEIIIAVGFINKYKNLLISCVLIIALLIVGRIWWNDNTAKNQKHAADKLFSVKVDYENKNYEKVIADGQKSIGEFSGYNQSGEIMLLVAKAYVSLNRVDEAVKVLEKCASSFSGDDLLTYSANYMLGIISLDKAAAGSDKSAAEAAASFFEKAAKTNSSIFANQCKLFQAKAFILAEKKDNAKTILNSLDKDEELEYTIKDRVKKMLAEL